MTDDSLEQAIRGAPIAGRVTAIADLFDTLTADRPYKKPWPIEQALALIADGADQHFDPDLVEAFQRVLPEILGLRERFSD